VKRLKINDGNFEARGARTVEYLEAFVFQWWEKFPSFLFVLSRRQNNL
jgi:hypothetical protein